MKQLKIALKLLSIIKVDEEQFLYLHKLNLYRLYHKEIWQACNEYVKEEGEYADIINLLAHNDSNMIISEDQLIIALVDIAFRYLIEK